jgi:predicted PurR-regulated permease PerM
MVVSIVFYPVYSFILRFVRWRPLASFITICLILLVIFGPFSYLSYLLTQELNSLIEHLKTGKFDTLDRVLQHPSVRRITLRALSLFNVSEGDFQKAVTDNLSQLGKESIGKIGRAHV